MFQYAPSLFFIFIPLLLTAIVLRLLPAQAMEEEKTAKPKFGLNMTHLQPPIEIISLNLINASAISETLRSIASANGFKSV